MWWVYVLIGVGAILLTLIAVILIRTACFKPKKEEPVQIQEIDFDKDRAVECLRSLIKCKTVSNVDSEKEDEKEFKKLIDSLPVLYPNVYKTLEFIPFEDRGILFKWKGKTDNAPSIFMSHYDVVSVEESDWKKPPFDAIIEDEYLWGRGALDTKQTFNGAMFAVDHLIKEGFTPNADVYLAFSGGEEINGKGAINIMNYFKERGITPELVLDEGGAVVSNVFPGVKEPCALVGIAEKGMMNIKYTVKSNGGHASAPKPDSPLAVLSKACVKLDKNPFKMKMSDPVKKMFDTLGRRSTFLYRMIFSNLWLFKGLLSKISKKSGGEMNALFRTTLAVTMAQGSKGINVLPAVAEFYSNSRINPLESTSDLIKTVKKTIDDDRIVLSVLNQIEPSRISRTDTVGFDRIKTAIKEVWDNVTVSPYLMVQCSDCRYYGEISDRVYRFSPMALSNEERATVHGNNERIKIVEAQKTVEFYIRLIKNC